jgi:hypothetical protein
MALKYRPPTIAVIYKMKDNKTMKMKKYIHEILITFPEDTESIDVNRMCDEICRKETTYLNPAFISRQQVSSIFITNFFFRFLNFSESSGTSIWPAKLHRLLPKLDRQVQSQRKRKKVESVIF